ADAALESVTAETANQPSSNGTAAERRIAELEEQSREASERALRSHAELENFRKRSQRELADERRYAVVPLVRDLLPVVDNLERAIDAAQKQADTLARRASEGNAHYTSSDITHYMYGVKIVNM